ncbi:MAG: TIGR04086 family membrane protein [Clostridia bacterium]|nr:TIGR04086 family membrane protein [Clostridia bacterium]
MKVKALKGENRGGLVLSIMKGVTAGLCVSLIGILIFAFVLRFTSISDTIIAPVNQVIKGVSIFFGVFIGMKKHKEMGLLSGLLIGFFFTICAFLVFSLLDGNFTFDRTLLNDIIFGGVIGAICGIICVNLKKN